MTQGGGYAFEAQGLFLGWVRAGDLNAIRSLGGEEFGEKSLRGRIATISRVFQWQQGDGTYVEGTMDVD